MPSGAKYPSTKVLRSRRYIDRHHIQNTQNRDAKAIHLKLDELIRSTKDARDSLVDLEDLSDDDLKKLQQQFKALRENHAFGDDEPIEAIEDELQEREIEA